jgi:hypothetical protein
MLHCRVASVALMLALAAPRAHAFFDPPWITPATPTAGQTISVNIYGGICDGVIEWPGYPQITWNGGSIRIVEYGVHVGSPDLCIYPEGTLSVPVGSFPAGDYLLTVDFAYDDALYGPTIMTLGVVPFTVLGPVSAAAVPTFNHWGLLALALVISCSSLWVLRTRRRRNCR